MGYPNIKISNESPSVKKVGDASTPKLFKDPENGVKIPSGIVTYSGLHKEQCCGF